MFNVRLAGDLAVRLAVVGYVFDDVSTRTVLFSHEMSWMRSGMN